MGQRRGGLLQLPLISLYPRPILFPCNRPLGTNALYIVGHKGQGLGFSHRRIEICNRPYPAATIAVHIDENLARLDILTHLYPPDAYSNKKPPVHTGDRVFKSAPKECGVVFLGVNTLDMAPPPGHNMCMYGFRAPRKKHEKHR